MCSYDDNVCGAVRASSENWKLEGVTGAETEKVNGLQVDRRSVQSLAATTNV